MDRHTGETNSWNDTVWFNLGGNGPPALEVGFCIPRRDVIRDPQPRNSQITSHPGHRAPAMRWADIYQWNSAYPASYITTFLHNTEYFFLFIFVMENTLGPLLLDFDKETFRFSAMQTFLTWPILFAYLLVMPMIAVFALQMQRAVLALCYICILVAGNMPCMWIISKSDCIRRSVIINMPLGAMREQKHHCCCCFTGVFSTLLGVILVAVGISFILNYGISSEVLPPQWQSTEGKKILGIILVCCGCGFLIIGILVGALYFAVCSKSRTEPSSAVPTQVISQHDNKGKGSNGGKSRRSSSAVHLTKMPPLHTNQCVSRPSSLGRVSPTTSTTSRNGTLPRFNHTNELNPIHSLTRPHPSTAGGHRRRNGKGKHNRKHKKVLQTMPEECEEIELASRAGHGLHPSIRISKEHLYDNNKSQPLPGIENPALMVSDEGSSVVTGGTVTPPSNELSEEGYAIPSHSLSVASVSPVSQTEKEELAKDIADILR